MKFVAVLCLLVGINKHYHGFYIYLDIFWLAQKLCLRGLGSSNNGEKKKKMKFDFGTKTNLVIDRALFLVGYTHPDIHN